METLTKFRSRFLHLEHFAVLGKSEAGWRMAARDRDDLGTPAMEIASHARAFAVTSFRDS